MLHNLTNNKTTNYQINTMPTVQEQLLEVLKELPASIQLHHLEKLAMKIRKENSVRINNDQMKAANKYPKMK